MYSREEMKFNQELREYFKYVKRLNYFFVWYFGELSKKKNIRRRDDFKEFSLRVGKDVNVRRERLNLKEWEFCKKFLDNEKDLDSLLDGWGLKVDDFKWMVWNNDEGGRSNSEIKKKLIGDKNSLKNLSKKYTSDWLKNMRSEEYNKWFGNEMLFEGKRRDDRVREFWKVLDKVEKEVCHSGVDWFKIRNIKKSINEKGVLTRTQFDYFIFRLLEIRKVVDFMRDNPNVTKQRVRKEYEWILKYN